MELNEPKRRYALICRTAHDGLEAGMIYNVIVADDSFFENQPELHALFEVLEVLAEHEPAQEKGRFAQLRAPAELLQRGAQLRKGA